MNTIQKKFKLQKLLFSNEEKNVKLGIELAKNQGVFPLIESELHHTAQEFIYSGNEDKVYQAIYLARALGIYEDFALNINTAINDLCGWSIKSDQLPMEENDTYWVDFLTQTRCYSSRMYSNTYHAYIKEQEMFPSIFEQLTHLEAINLSCHKITALPEWIDKLTHLQTLNLYANRIQQLPKSIAGLQQLEELYLHGNCLDAIPRFLTDLPRLKVLDVSDNGIAEIPVWLPEMATLEELVLFTCWGSSPELAIPEEIGSMKNLKLLNVMTHTVTLPESIGQLQSLETLQLGGGKYPNEIPTNITQLKNLKYLQLDGAPLELILDIAGEFPLLETLSFKDVEDYHPTPEQIEQIQAKVPDGCEIIYAYSY